MSIWPFRRRPRGSAAAETRQRLPQPPPQPQQQHQQQQQDFPAAAVVNQEKGTAEPSTPAELIPPSPRSDTPATSIQPGTSSPPLRPPPVPRRSSRRIRTLNTAGDNASTSRRDSGDFPQAPPSPISQQRRPRDDASPRRQPRLRRGSREDITALPLSYTLDRSPHLRPVDSQRAHIPYNFQPASAPKRTDTRGADSRVTQKSELSAPPTRSQTLHSQRSATESAGLVRRTSSRLSRRRNDPVREEEIRSMSAPIPLPKRHGDGPLRRESKKVRGHLGGGDSHVSLPPEGSIHSSMSRFLEQRGWEIGNLAVFNPRPTVRLSGAPQYIVSTGLPQSPSGVLYRIDSISAQNQEPSPRGKGRKWRTIGDEADELDASDLRTVLERDDKRREKRQQDRRERLERKLRAREGRNRGDSDARRRRNEEDRARAEQQIQAQGPLTPPTEVHPALRNVPLYGGAESVGLGIASSAAMAIDLDDDAAAAAAGPHRSTRASGNDPAPDFFADAAGVPPLSLDEAAAPASSSSTLPLETPGMDEEPELGTAQAVQLSHTNTPPVSPTHRERMVSDTPQFTDAQRQGGVSAVSTSGRQPPLRASQEQRRSDLPREQREGSWIGKFRRRGSNLRKSGREAADPSEASFSNPSRESMRNQPLPAHLIGIADQTTTVRSPSGTPIPMQSKFREDLPETPTSPSGSTAQPADAPIVAPVSQTGRRHRAMTRSLASINSEGEWLAGGSSKRQSNQSALSRSLSKRNDFNASYEELGGDGDVEYLARNRSRKISNPAMIGASPDEESGEDAPPGVASSASARGLMGSVRHRPQLVQHDPRTKSSEGLVTETLSAEPVETAESPGTPFETPNESPAATISDADDEDDADSPDPTIQRATSVNYTSGHSRQFSAGSAKLLDVQAKPSLTNKGQEDGTSSPYRPATSGA